MGNIRAGAVAEAVPSSGDWVFVDLGFSQKSKSCGLLLQDGNPERLTFAETQRRLTQLVAEGGGPLNIVLEAPLSVAFGHDGNPVGRHVETRDGESRYWYVGLGCSVLVAATYLVRAISAATVRDVRLFEGLVSFKQKGFASDHCHDVLQLRDVVWGKEGVGRLIAPGELAAPNHTLLSAFAVAGMDYGVPPVVAVGG